MVVFHLDLLPIFVKLVGCDTSECIMSQQYLIHNPLQGYGYIWNMETMD